MAAAFDGPLGGIVARLMASMNAGAERETVEILNPAPHDRVLVVGFGPGVGIDILAPRVPEGRILGLDPSAAMMKAAGKRCRKWIEAGVVRLSQSTADQIEEENGSFSAVVAVNSLQMCEPIEATAAELARVLAPRGHLVSLTHGWAAAKHAGSADAWIEQTRKGLAGAGFGNIQSGFGKSEKGKSILLTAERAGPD